MLASDGRCKTLDAKASGYVRGESCGVLRTQMSTVHDATMPHDDNIVHVAGSSVNQDGRSSALTAPNGPSQQRAIRIALQSASMPASGVHNLQMHGTGTPLGDPIEVGGSFAVLVQAKGRVSPLVMSAAKSAVGHTEPGAGAVGLLQVVHDLRTTSVAPVMHLTSVNPHMIGVLTTPAYAFMKSATQLARDSATRELRRELVRVPRHQRARHRRAGVQFDDDVARRRRRLVELRMAHGVAVDRAEAAPSRWSRFGTRSRHGGGCGRAEAQHARLSLGSPRARPGAVPGAGFFETAAAFGAMLRGGAPCALTGVSIPMPLALPDPSDASFRSVVIACSVSCANSAVSISSSARMTHIRGSYAQHRSLSRDAAIVPSLENVSAGRAGASSPVGAVGAYERVAASGLQYGPAFAVLTSIRRPSDAAGVVAGHLWIDDVGVRRGCFVHPATLDASMQVSAAAYAATASSEQSATRVPAALGAYTIARRSQDTHAWVMARAVSSSDASAISNHWIVDREGGAFANLHQLDARVIGARPTAAGGSQVTQPVTGATCLYEMRWTIAATAGLHESDALLASRGGRVLTTGSAPALAQPRKASGTPIATDVVGISHRLTSADCRVLSASVRMLELAQCASMLRVRRFELVTRGAHAPAAVSAAAGTARVARRRARVSVGCTTHSRGGAAAGAVRRRRRRRKRRRDGADDDEG
ncbi:phenolphthiocerol/phthiocerol polyketide synthase [Pseudoscourfieldia marina]